MNHNWHNAQQNHFQQEHIPTQCEGEYIAQLAAHYQVSTFQHKIYSHQHSRNTGQTVQHFCVDFHVVPAVGPDVFYDGKMTVGQYMILNRKRFDSFDEENLIEIFKTQINDIENGNTHPTVYTLCLLSLALKVSPYQLFTLLSDIPDK